MGTTIGDVKGDTRSLDYTSHASDQHNNSFWFHSCGPAAVVGQQTSSLAFLPTYLPTYIGSFIHSFIHSYISPLLCVPT